MTRLAAILPLLSLLLLAGCGADPETERPKVSVASASAGDLSVELLADGRLETGMTPVYLKVTNAAGPVTDAEVTFAPLMSMGNGMDHACPVIGSPALGPDGLYRVDVVFQMASSDMNTWSATVGITRPGTAAVEASFSLLPVADSGRARTFAYTDPDTLATSKYVASLTFLSGPRVGLNPVIVTLHRMQDMMTFVPVTDVAMALDPQMPSMGHGSAGSVAPTHTTLGRYEGLLSFSMPGTWETTVTVTRGGVTLGAPMFTTDF